MSKFKALSNITFSDVSYIPGIFPREGGRLLSFRFIFFTQPEV